MKILKIALLSIITIGLVFSFAFATVNMAKGRADMPAPQIAYEEDVIFCIEDAFKK